MSAPHSEACDADDCPCFLAGVEALRLEFVERETAVVEAMTGFVEMLNGSRR